ncbi:MAG: peptidylprolyl isomerase [Gammaproteobacteria bacterium]|nr:peptidylprolyl isomerase [Gammaproteobacteria bacterium]
MKKAFRFNRFSRLLLPILLLSGNLLRPVFADVPLDRIVAIVNDDVVMMSELENKIRTVQAQMRQANQQPPPSSALEKQILDRIILNKLQLQTAEQTGIRVSEDILNRAISNIAAQNQVSLKEFREILEGDGYSFEQFREDIRNEITISQLRQRQVENRITVTDREIDNFLATQEHQGETETQYHIGHILISLPEDASKEDEEASRLIAQKVIDDLKAGHDFADMAATVSDGQQAADGGSLGWRKKNQIPSLFSEYIDDMQPGDISEPIRNPSGFHIIKLLEIRSAEQSIVTQTRSRHILIRTNDLVSDDQAREKLEELLYRLEQGDKFEQLAKAYSEDTISALQGGDLDWTNPGDLVPQFEEVMNELETGQISEPFKTPYGWHIVQVIDRREHDNTENARRTRAREIIKKRKSEEAHQNWLRNLRQEAYVQYRLNEY